MRLAWRWFALLVGGGSICGSSASRRSHSVVVIFGDVASLAWKWHKPLTAQLLPITGRKAGDHTEFESQYLFNTTLQALPRDR